MLTSEQALKLIDAGFTAAEVRAMYAGEQREPEPEEATEPEQTPDPEPEQAPPEAPQALTAEDVRQIVADQLKLVQQTANARSADRTGGEAPKSVQDVLRDIVKSM